MKIEYIITYFEKHFLPIPYSLIYAVKFLTHGQRKEKMRAGISFPALTLTLLVRLTVANEAYKKK